MGGVGKTTALRGLCHIDEVQKAYPDGIYFLEFGKMQMMRKCQQRYVGASKTRVAMRWQRRWRRQAVDLGYVCEVKKLLLDASGSVLVVSTRFARISESVGNPTLFDALDARGEKAREILQKAACGSFINSGGTNRY
eukprot:IDg23722t1